jgi:hypothetical protein
MYEARLILPLTDNSGGDLRDVHSALQSTLCDAWGGYTRLVAIGGWRGNAGVIHERVALYDIAMPATDSDAAKLESIAVMFGTLARQHAVYIRLASGMVRIVPCSAVRLAA